MGFPQKLVTIVILSFISILKKKEGKYENFMKKGFFNFFTDFRNAVFTHL